MIFGGLSEQELLKITTLLDFHQVFYKIKTDSVIDQINHESMQNNLRHLNPPSISTHILAIEISDDSFDNMSEKLRSSLLDFGITNIAPEDFIEPETQNLKAIHSEILSGNKKIVGFSFLHQFAIVIIISLIGYFLTKN